MDVIDVLYRLRNMASIEADRLRAYIAEAQAVLDKLDVFADDAQDVAQLSAASDLFPSYSALVPERAGLAPTPPSQPLAAQLAPPTRTSATEAQREDRG